MSLEKLLRPRSIAVVGVSERPEAIGTRVWNNLRKMGYAGRMYPVNPRYPEFGGVPCHASLSALPEVVDAAFLGVPATAGPDLVDEAGRAGIRAVLTNANGYADGDEAGKALQERLVAAAAKHGIALCGPNNIGLMNVLDRTALWTPRYMEKVNPGPIAVIAQSGSIALILSEDERDLGFAYLVTAGNEAVTTVADYLEEVVKDERVKVVLLFLETIRQPETFFRAAAEARRRGTRIVALKLGTSPEGRTLVQAHTGSLAGEDRLYDAYFDALDIVRVRDLDEMLETAVILSRNTAALPEGGPSVVTLSGGEAALIADLGSELGLKFEDLSADTLARLRPAYPPYSSVHNPVDAWGLGFNAERFGIVLHALLDDPRINFIGFSIDAPGRGGGDVPYALVMAEACVAAKTTKRLAFFNNTSGSGVNAEVRAVLDRADIPYLSGLRPALAAIRNLVHLPPAGDLPTTATLPRIAMPLPTSEPDCFRLLREHGVPMIEAARAASADEAASIAGGYGYPVVLKGIAPTVAHKSDLGLVALRLEDEAAVRAAFADLSGKLARLGAAGEIVVQRMAGEGVELILGIRNQPGFGSFVIAGPGGVLVELGNQACVRRGPVSEDEALAMLSRTAAGRLLDGVRGRPACDRRAAARAIAAFSRVGAALAGTHAALEINPLVVTPEGAVGVDFLHEPHASER